MSVLPVVFIHQGNSDYLFKTFYQLKQWNPQTTPYMLGTKASKVYEPWIKHEEIGQYMGWAQALSKVFFNLSTNGADYELFCIQRWFVLYEFMQAKGLERALYLDSDVFVYDDLTKEGAALSSYGMTLCHMSGHTNYVSDVKVLKHFCEYIFWHYETEEGKQILHDWLKEYRDGGETTGGISDMTFIRKYWVAFPENVYNLNQIVDKKVYDVAFSVSDYFGYQGEDNGLTGEKVKVIQFENQQPYCKHDSEGLVRFVTLHFQGKSKQLMPQYLTKKGAEFQRWEKRFQQIYNMQRLWNKVKRMLRLA